MSQSLAPEEAARFRRLPFYLEHKLLLQKFDGESEWEFEVTDPTWQAICWYYCFALRLALAGKTEPALDVVLKALESGTALNHFEAYPHDWDPDGILNLRDPADVAMDLMGHAYELSWSLPTSISSSPIGLDGYEAHMKQSKRGGFLHFSKETLCDVYNVVIMDDGVFRSAEAIYPEFKLTFMDDKGNPTPGPNEGGTVAKPILLGHPTLDTPEVRREIWRRWWLAWDLSEPTDMRTEDGQTFGGVKVIAALLSDNLKSFDDVDPILTAVSTWRERAAVIEGVGRFIEQKSGLDLRKTDAMLQGLSQTAKAQLPPRFTSRLL